VSLSNGLYQLQTVFALVFARMFLKEDFTGRKAKGILLSLVGVIIVVVPPIINNSDASDDEDGSENNDVLLGTLWTIASALGWGGYEVAYQVSVWGTRSHTRSEATSNIIASSLRARLVAQRD